jgi:preprotein translocase subunit SecE
LAGSSSLSTRANKLNERKLLKLKKYITDSIDELRNKVTWPKYSELQSSSVLVLIASMIFALIIGAIDFVFDNIMSWFYKEF